MRPLLAFLLLAAISAPAQTIAIVPFAEGLSSPVALTHAGDGSGRVFITEQIGTVAVWKDGAIHAEKFLDIRHLVRAGGEQGLLSIAFHPAYPANGFFYVNYTNTGGDTVIARYRVSASDPDRADPASAKILLTVDQPFTNHNGGQLQFGPDGYLYIGMGDGGSGGDPQNHAQNLLSLLGKMLRIDVDGGDPYAIPPDNPFRFNARGEIWSYGLRNPWRFSFDRVTGDLFIADVGQNAFEEVNFQPGSSSGGENWGWRRMEATHCFNPSTACNDGTLSLPILEYGRADGCSVTGGYRYRGLVFPSLMGTYLFGDFCTGRIWGARPEPDGSWARELLLDTALNISSFGEDQSGELYVLSLGGTVHRIVDTRQARRRAVGR